MIRWARLWSKAESSDGGEAVRGEQAGAEKTRRFRLSDQQLQTMRYLAVLVLVGIALMSLNVRPESASVPQGEKPSAADTMAGVGGPADDYARALERQVEQALRQLYGVGVVHVSVTLASGPEQIVAEQRTSERRVSQGAGGEHVVTDERSSAQPVLVRSDQLRREEPIVLVERAPVVQGVLVVTDAAADSRLRYELTRSVMTLLNLPAHRVYVLPQRW